MDVSPDNARVRIGEWPFAPEVAEAIAVVLRSGAAIQVVEAYAGHVRSARLQFAAQVEAAAANVRQEEQRWTTTEQEPEPVPDWEVAPSSKVTEGRRAFMVRQLSRLKERGYTRKQAISPMLKLNARICEPPLTLEQLQGPLDATWPHTECERETKRGV